MMTTEQKLALAETLQDRSWAQLREYKDDIHRIMTSGPNGTERDTLIVQMVFAHTHAELCQRAATGQHCQGDEDD
jgi:hypothetical protein